MGKKTIRYNTDKIPADRPGGGILSSFSCIAFADEDEYSIHNKFFNILSDGMKSKLISYMPPFISGSIEDMGLSNTVISGSRLSVPYEGIDDKTIKRLLNAANRSKKHGSDIIILEDKVLCENAYNIVEQECNVRVARGVLYSPLAFIESAKSVSGLMGIDFKRSNICIADAACEIGLEMTELLLNEACYLILCTADKKKINDNTLKYIKMSGLSPVVVSNFRKAAKESDILVYTGGIDINEFISFSERKLLIINMSHEYLKLSKDIFTIDDVILNGPNEPQIGDETTDILTFMKSTVWEAVISIVSGIDAGAYEFGKSIKAAEYARDMGIKVRAVIKSGSIMDRESIYRYK